MMSITHNQKQVARECGIAVSTVSNILGTRGHLYSETTRKRVLEAAQRLGCRSSSLGSALRSNRSNFVGLLLGRCVNPAYAELFDALSYAVHNHGYDVLSHTPVQAGDWPEIVRMFRSWVVDWKACAVAAMLPNQRIDPVIRQLMAQRVLLWLNEEPPEGCSGVYPDRPMIARLAVKHLVELGHKRIGIVCGSTGDTRETVKYGAIQQEMARHGLRWRNDDLYTFASPLAKLVPAPGEEGFSLGMRFGQMSERPTAVIALSNLAANCFAAGFMAAGKRIPQDLSVLSYDHTILASTTCLPLTVVGVPVQDYARRTVELLHRLVEAGRQGEEKVERLKLKPELLVRYSTGPASAPSN